MRKYLYLKDGQTAIDYFDKSMSANDIIFLLREEYGNWVTIEHGYFLE